MIKLPTEVQKVTSQNPRKLIIFAQTKAGKTEACSKLQNALLLDTEEGSEFIESFKIDLKKECKEQKINPMIAIEQIAEALEAEKQKTGKYPYDYLILDSITEMEDFANAFATAIYKATAMGKNYSGNNVVQDLPNGGGWAFQREAFERLLEPLEGKYNKALILIGHVKNASINKLGKELQAKDLAIAGKMKMILCSQADAIGYMYRNPQNANQTILSFKTHEQDLATGARPPHLSNQEFVICELENPDYIAKKEPKRFKTYWDKIFI